MTEINYQTVLSASSQLTLHQLSQMTTSYWTPDKPTAIHRQKSLIASESYQTCGTEHILIQWLLSMFCIKQQQQPFNGILSRKMFVHSLPILHELFNVFS